MTVAIAFYLTSWSEFWGCVIALIILTPIVMWLYARADADSSDSKDEE